METEITFASPAALQAFAGELTGAVAQIAAKHQSSDRPGGRSYRIVLGAHPTVTKTPEEAASRHAGHSGEENRT
jgi:hypothetical protein